MTLFTNPNFIEHIVRSQRAEPLIDRQHYDNIRTLIEVQTRLVLETAAKFMRRDRRDMLALEDVELAAKELNHVGLASKKLKQTQLVLAPFSTYQIEGIDLLKEDKVYKSASELLEQQLAVLEGRSLLAPRLDGRWIYLKGKVPNTNNNIHIKRQFLQSQSEKQQREERRILWNIIKDEPYSYLNEEQSDFFMSICKIISGDQAPAGKILVDGNLNSLMPFLLKFLGSAPLNQTGISFLLQLLENSYVWKAVQFGAVKTLNLLLAYRGPQSFQVGVKIAQIVESLCDKYPILRDLYLNYEDESYSTILKKIPFQIYLGIPFKMTEELLARCKQDAEKNDKLAILCLKALLQHSSHLRVFKRLLAQKMNTFVYWHPCSQTKDDPYLKMY